MMLKNVILTLAAGIIGCASFCVNDCWARMPDKIVKPDSLATVNDNQTKFSADHPFNRALVSAFNTNPKLRSQVKAQYAQAESVSQALSGWRPTINLQGTIGRSWTQTVSSPLMPPLTPSVGTVYDTNKSAQLNIKQNLFQGGQTVARVAKAKANVYAGFSALASTEQDTLYSAINVYLTLWSKRTIYELNNNNVKIKQKTLAQTQARYQVGELTLTDVSQAKADLAGAIAQQISARADVNKATEAYLQVVGEPAGDVPPPPPLINVRTMPVNRAEVEKRALKNNPDVMSAEYNRQALYHAIDDVKSAILPSFDLVGSASRNLDTNIRSAGQRQNSASIGLNLSVPIYQGGSEWSQIRQATQLAAKAKIDLITTQRQTLQTAVQNWEDWQSYAAQIQQIEVQVQAAKVTVEGTHQENLVGERTVLDVLTAENALLKAETDLTTAQQNYLLTGYSVLVAMGELTAVDLNLSVEAYPVKENYEYVQSQLIGGSEYPTR